MSNQSLKGLACKAVDQIQERLIAISHEIHQNPELAFEEVKASQLLADELERNGFIVERGAAGLPTAFVGRLQGKEEGPTVAIVCEYDALPDLGHACGHNIMGAAGIGAGIALVDVLKELPGKVVVLGAPAEERGGGKLYLIKAGYLEGVDAALVVHPGSRTVVHADSIASYGLVCRYHGKPAHAAGSPHEGINALDGAIQTFNNVNALRQHLKSDVRIHGIISHGGVAPNIVPEYAEAKFFIRSIDKQYHLDIIEKFKRCAEAGALAAGARLEMEEISPIYEPLRSNRTLEAVFQTNLAALGWIEDGDDTKGLGSTDMGNITQVVPGIHPSMAIGPKTMVGHSQEMCVASASPAGDQCVVDAAKVMAMTAVDILTNSELRAALWREHRS